MFPTVAPFPPVQPHHLHHYPTHDALHQPPYDLNDPAFPARNDPLQTFLQPIPFTPSTATSQHALRRKTPNGTLAAGYDGTLGESTLQPATKHILVSPMDSGQFFSPQGMPTDTWQQQIIDPSASKHMNFPPVFKNEAGNPIAPGEVVQDVNGTSWVRPVNYPPGIDSMLNQSLPLQASQRFLLQNGSYIPTVLPATLQPCVGPTASAGTGPFGPYWPDGAYIPYRPVAFREPRFGTPDPNAQAFL
ncbi:hypothetical protein N7523_010173 [Penicillium sp. IBT 18751x]|nr:hypothetical protein N7523_010173 [Penicillium sp. IBT 18751x]